MLWIVRIVLILQSLSQTTCKASALLLFCSVQVQTWNSDIQIQVYLNSRLETTQNWELNFRFTLKSPLPKARGAYAHHIIIYTPLDFQTFLRPCSAVSPSKQEVVWQRPISRPKSDFSIRNGFADKGPIANCYRGCRPFSAISVLCRALRRQADDSITCVNERGR